MITGATLLTENEWFNFLQHEVSLPNVARNETVRFAKQLADSSMTIDDFSELTEQQLETNFNFDQIGLINRIKKWQNNSVCDDEDQRWTY
ncbi:unnamed protein product [Rotaria sordida]|uniref:Uncharacterized protein n=1 Tax=Rotaria sordida TaxID=392033 RepID=A0A814LQE3_9BILA|nr:unnamed protein product [Rotaria sordida]CAF1248145.1 unnamed protein product [Rotaria sordida]